MVVGYDLDGVLFRSPEGVDRKDYRPIRMAEYYRLQVPTGFMPEGDDFVLITARRNRYRKPTLETLKAFGIVPDDFDDENRLFMHPPGGSKSRDTCIAHKADSIEKAGVVVFYEDDEKIASALNTIEGVEVRLVKLQ